MEKNECRELMEKLDKIIEKLNDFNENLEMVSFGLDDLYDKVDEILLEKTPDA